MAIFVHALAEVAPPRVGIHLQWSGPHGWVFSPPGWRIQRRLAHGRPRLDCVALTAAELALLRDRHELGIRFGVVTERLGACPVPVAPVAPTRALAIVVPGTCEIITLELTAPAPRVRVQVEARASFAVGLRDGKVVAGGRNLDGAAVHDLFAEGIDTVVVYARALSTISWCLELRDANAADWDAAPTIARVQLPLRPLMPLADGAAELAEARSRLLPGEAIDADEFAHLAALLRRMIARVGADRPIELAMWTHADATIDPEETCALDALRAVLPHPTWRRALGFAWFDRDPALVPGHSYEYRISAAFPGGDLVDAIYGLHTIPASTPVPAEFFLGALRVRLPQPTVVASAEAAGPVGSVMVSRHGLALAPERLPWWIGPDLEGWSAVIDLPRPTRTVVLALRGAHSLTYAGGVAWGPWSTATTPVPAGERVTLTFAAPIEQLRLGGRGFWCGLRIPADLAAAPVVVVARVTPPIPLVQTPLPAPPLAAAIANLQRPQPAAPTDVPTAAAPPREELGFEVRWQPAPDGGIVMWPPDLPPPPSAATLFQIEHLATDVAGATWRPLIDGDNLITGHRDGTPPSIDGGLGADLLARYPEVPQPSAGNGTSDLVWPDVFDFAIDGEAVPRPAPSPNTHHRYRVRAVDPIGRPSATWTETVIARLEKWAPPPVPVGPDALPAAQQAAPGPTGVHARVLVRGASDLSDDERALLGGHANAIVLRWGWHPQQRTQDPTAAEFRLYLSRRDPTGVRAQLTTVVDHGAGRCDVTLILERAVHADDARGLRLDAGYPFEILGHDAGTTIVARLITRVPLAGGAFAIPRIGPIVMPVRLTPEATRPPAWGPRLQIRAIDSATTYESLPIFDALTLTAGHPRDQLWLGVSTADAQPYVPDALPAGRPGNESAIVPIRVQGRYQERPIIVEVPALDPVPVVVAPEPSARPMEAKIDLAPLLAGTGLAAGATVRLERVSDVEVVQAYRVEGARVIARVLEPHRPGDAEHDLAIANPTDRAAVIAALGGATAAALDDRFVVFLAASHPQRARLFQPAIALPVVLPIVTDVLPSTGARWVYRARVADAAGNLSADGVTLRGVVRVPITRLTPPQPLPREPGDPPTRLRLRVDGSGEVTHLIVFQRVVPRDPPADPPELVRVASAPHLALADRAKLRFADGTLLAGALHVAPPPAADGPGRAAIVDVAVAAGTRVRLWACAITRDGVVSPLAGPFAIVTPPPPLVAPVLAIAGAAPNLIVSWTWPTPADAVEVIVERSADGTRFERVSARLAPAVSTTLHRAPPGTWRFRLRARSLDGRDAVSNTVEV